MTRKTWIQKQKTASYNLYFRCDCSYLYNHISMNSKINLKHLRIRLKFYILFILNCMYCIHRVHEFMFPAVKLDIKIFILNLDSGFNS